VEPAPAALPGPEVVFSRPVYDRGAMTLQALRRKIGDRAFVDLLRTWYRDHRGGNVTTADFIALAERKSGARPDRLLRRLALPGGQAAELVTR
jgi:aminopeptidase N